jgi:hypothetical protein
VAIATQAAAINIQSAAARLNVPIMGNPSLSFSPQAVVLADVK